ncbi:hypothetical protein [uncultured Ruegeria sp.]|uniref:hypothetical protein n=1 Tax=uncultured Ruegeria sp. TaxID=259304 RepID=UPI002634E953|nr:hypothetical protein [uncultured Ruegeria sp.]
MRSTRLRYSVITAVLISACIGSPLRAEEAGQGDALSRLVAHFGEVVVLPSTQRVVFYPTQGEVWGLSIDDRIIERGHVEVEPRPDWRLDLYWRNGVLDVLDASNVNNIQFTDETPLIIDQLNQIAGKRLALDIPPLLEGTQLLEGGIVLDGADNEIGDWEVRTTGIGFYPPDGPRVDFRIADLIAALPETKAENN